MRHVQLKDAKAGLSALIDAAAKGRPAVITRHGKPEAVILAHAEYQRLARLPSFADLLVSIPAAVEPIPQRGHRRRRKRSV
jgi:prevent-host-death family protein